MLGRQSFKLTRNLRGSDLHGAESARAILVGRDLSNANLFAANLCGANAQGAKFVNANMVATDLSGVDGRNADFSGANLQGAVMIRAKLQGAVFTGAIVDGLVLTGATGANLEGTILGNAPDAAQQRRSRRPQLVSSNNEPTPAAADHMTFQPRLVR